METIVWVVHVIAAAAVIGLVLLQHGKGADMGAAFGSGASGSLFGVSGSANLLSRTTAGMVTVFFITSMTLAYLSGHGDKQSSVVKQATRESPVANKAADAPQPADSSKARDIPQ